MKKIINSKIILVIIVIVSMASFWLSNSRDNAVLNEQTEIAVGTGMKIIAFGDSLTAGYGLPISESYPALLERELKSRGLNVNVINSGVSGETTRGNLERAVFIRDQNPDVVLLGIGGNDALRLLAVEETRNNIAKTIEILKSGDNPPSVVLLQMQAPVNVGLEYKKIFDNLYQELAEEYELALLPFITAEVFLQNENKLSDGIHFNKQGYQKIVELYLVEPITKIIQELPS